MHPQEAAASDLFGVQGTVSSKKKKKNKLKRVVATVKKAARKDKMSKQESFAAVQLLHDPQVYVCHSHASRAWPMAATILDCNVEAGFTPGLV